MNVYTFFWTTGDTDVLQGDTATDALNNAGFGAGALRALDFYALNDVRDEWEWDSAASTWNRAVK